MDEVTFTDQEARQLLMLLHKYAESIEQSDLPFAVIDLAADLAMSMDETDDASDYHRRECERLYVGS